MKKFFGTLFKFFIFLTYPVLLAVIIGGGYFLYTWNEERESAVNNFQRVANNYQIPSDNVDEPEQAIERLITHIESLETVILEKDEQISGLNDQIEKDLQEGYGEINGNILPFVTSGQRFNQYQRVCAQTIENEQKQYCVSVSAVQGEYSLVVPAGNYYVFAQLQDGDNQGARAYYTEFIQCEQQDSNEVCNQSLSDNYIEVTVNPQQTIEGVDPADWQFKEE